MILLQLQGQSWTHTLSVLTSTNICTGTLLIKAVVWLRLGVYTLVVDEHLVASTAGHRVSDSTSDSSGGFICVS
jgi:hypothetical protein